MVCSAVFTVPTKSGHTLCASYQSVMNTVSMIHTQLDVVSLCNLDQFLYDM